MTPAVTFTIGLTLAVVACLALIASFWLHKQDEDDDEA